MTALLRWEPDPAPRTFGERLAWVRRRLGLSVREVAERTGFAESTIPTWEKGAMPRDPVRVATVYQRTLHADRDWLLYGEADDVRLTLVRPQGLEP